MRFTASLVMTLAGLAVGAPALAKSVAAAPQVAMSVKQTPPERFLNLPDYPFAVHEVKVPWGPGQVAMRYVDEGPRTGKVILLLHGQPSWSYLYRKVIAGLVAKGYRVIAPDLIGYGRSDKPAAMGDYSYARQVSAMEAFVTRLRLDDVTIGVHDWGGLIGLRVVADLPTRFSRIAIFNTSLNDGTEIETPRYKASFDAWIKLLHDVPYVDVNKVIAAQTAQPLPPDVGQAYLAPFPDGSYQSGVRVMSALIPRSPDMPGAAENKRARAFFHGWTKPVLIAFSEDSERIHPGQFASFADLFPKPSIWLATHIPGTKHFLFEDKPDAVVALLDRFARGAPAGDDAAAVPAPQAATAGAPASTAPAPVNATPAATASAGALSGSALQASATTYVGFGAHRTGTGASAKTLEWLQGRLTAAGFRTERQSLPFKVPETRSATVTLGGRTIMGMPAYWPSWTGPEGITAQLRPLDKAGRDDLALVVLPYSRVASLYDPAYRAILDTIASRKPRGVIAITEHPTQQLVGMNVREADAGRVLPPMLLVAQKDARALNAAINQKATLVLDGTTRDGTDANLIGEAGPAGKALVITTPLNGWFGVGGERAPGVAIALGLAEWARSAHPDWAVRVAFTTGHELGGAGMRAVLADSRFKPDAVRLWLNLGANIATLTPRVEGDKLVRSAAPNPVRGAAVDGGLLDKVARAFAGQPGYDTPSDAQGARAPGEITLILRNGTYRIVGLVGYQLLHHTAMDDARSTSGSVLAPVAAALARIAGEAM